MFEMELVKKKGSKRAELNDYGFIPVWRYIHHSAGGKTTYYTMPVAKMERNPDLVPDFPESARSKMKASVESIRKRLVCPEKG
jgi:hypothetical protein